MKKKIWMLVITIPCVLLLLFSFTFIPHKLVNITPSDVSKIKVFDGNTGYQVEITDRKHINHIINNLNGVTFKKGKPSFMYMGYSFRTTIFDHKGKPIKELTINSSDTIRYKGFFYTSTNKNIDYDYIEKLVRK
ncbi:hypothetical protein [Neobacillus niacini]|uniref:hypothetical protein n=1 Tax=Neobacillus niacini TaxID=86668 RepID=UPI002559EA1B